MKWISKQVTLPLLIAISLTSISAGLIYYIYKKDEEDSSNSILSQPKKNKRIKEIKVPREFIPAVIGRGGVTVKNIEDSTSTRIKFGCDNLDNNERICSIHGKPENITLAEAMIKDVIQSQPIVESYNMYVNHKFYTSLLVGRCQIINDIQAITRAKIILDRVHIGNNDDQRRIIIKGTAEQIAAALSQIEDYLLEFNSAQEQLNLGKSARPIRNKNVFGAGKNSDSQSGAEMSSLEGTMDVYVSAVESPSQFWVQVIGPGTLALDDLVKTMTAYYSDKDNRAAHAIQYIQRGQTVAAKYSFDNSWYRSEVVRESRDDKFEVFFLDYGDHEVMDKENILELRTDFLSLRFQAIEFTLANVSPTEDDWTTEAIERFESMTATAQWKVLVAKVRGYKERFYTLGSARREGSPIPSVDLFYKTDENQEINIGKQLVIESLAICRDGSWSAGGSANSLSRRSCDNSKGSNSLKFSQSQKKFSTKHKNSKKFTEVDLTTPKKSYRATEEIDLVTPEKSSSRNLIKAERTGNIQENGSDDDEQHQLGYRTNGNGQTKPKANAIPGGYESNHADFDGMEIF